MEKKEIIEKLSKIPLFSNLQEDEIEKVAEITNIETYKNNEYVIHAGEFGEKLYIILKGQVTVLKKTFSNEFYTVVDLSEKEDAFFGEFSLLDNEKRSASILTKTPCTFLCIAKDDFENLVSQNYKIGYIVIKQIAIRLSKRLRAANEDIITLFQALENEIEGED